MAPLSDRANTLLERLAQVEPAARDARDQVRVARAPGRVNLIGEHTDYNQGYVMPVAISLETWIASFPRRDGQARFSSVQERGTYDFDVLSPGTRRDAWIDYVAGVAWSLGEDGVPLRGVTAVVDSDVPIGSGLSSSAALELAAAWTLSERAPPPLDKIALARAAQRAENGFVGVQSGLMDQFASANGRAGHALLLDCRTFDFHAPRIPADVVLVAIDTRVPRRLAASEYNARRSECERGVALLSQRHVGVSSLRDVTPGMLREATDLLDSVTLRRCRHVVEENDRVLAVGNALVQDQLDLIGPLFAASHESLRDLYEVSSPELDGLVEIASSVPGVIGARMTGAGFGGCTVNLVRDDAVEDLREVVAREYPRRFGRDAGFHVVRAVDGAGVLDLPPG
ncbi:MAG TPA: galactokinase [Candidatus Limnocylindrales bacterium]|nr:galactokinase [Candidatus Limnocylindrales bacterium]